jgi:glyoxylase-like metal-dependent hydrolase (beta-lactamase superfamily II)
MTARPASAEPVPWTGQSISAGGWEITALSDGYLRLDGGGMWGVVPKALWQRMTPAADDNTILIALRPYLAVRGDDVVVIEVGLGRRWDAKLQAIYGMLPTESLEQTLAARGVAPEDVTHVVASHCHWDHVGAQVVERGGRLAAAFPNARHLAPSVEIDIARAPGHARSGSYRAEDVEPLLASGQLEGYAGTAELLPGLRAHVLGGHSDGVAVLTFGEDEPGDTAIFWSDVVPTTHHVQPPYVMAYDLDVVRSFEQRSAWLARAADAGWIGLFYHDVDHAFARVERADGPGSDRERYRAAPV